LIGELFEDRRAIPSARSDLFGRYVEKLLHPETVAGQDLDGLDFALRQLVRFSYLQTGGEPGFTNDRGVSVLSAAKDMLSAYSITLSPQKLLQLLLRAGVIRRSASRLRFFHDFFEVYFAAKAVQADWEDGRYDYCDAVRYSPKLKEVWEFAKRAGTLC
jgi:hypothetical protein